MTRDRGSLRFGGLEARLADWLASEAPHACPDRVLAAALEATRREPQVRSLRRSLSRLRPGAALVRKHAGDCWPRRNSAHLLRGRCHCLAFGKHRTYR